MALKLSDRNLYEKKESENRITPVVLPTFEENEAIRKKLQEIGLQPVADTKTDTGANKTESSIQPNGMIRNNASIGKSLTDDHLTAIQNEANQTKMKNAIKAYTERTGQLPDIAPGQSLPTIKAPLPEIPQTDMNRGLYAMQNAGAGFLSGVSSFAYGAENAIKDFGTGGERGAEINRLQAYLDENQSERNTLMLSASYDENRAVRKIAASAGVSEDTVRAYKKLETPSFQRQNAEEWANENNLSKAEKFLLGEAAYNIGENIPQMVLARAVPIGSSNTLVDTASKGIKEAAKAGTLNLKTAVKSVVDGIVNAAKSTPRQALLMGNVFGNSYFENQKQYGDEKRILENFVNSASKAFIEGFTENLGGFTDIGDIGGTLSSATGSTAVTIAKVIAQAVLDMAEEGTEEVINVPLSGIVDKLTFEPDKKWFGEGGVFDTAEMIRSGVSGALVGGLMGSFGTVVSVANAVAPATKGVNENVYSINAFADNMNPADIRAAAETLNRVSKNLGDTTTIDAKTATTEDIRNRSAELLDAIKEKAEAYKRGETDVAQTAQIAEKENANRNTFNQETERTGRESGANDDSIQTAKNISDAIGIPVRFYSAPGGEGIMENGYYKDGTIYVNAKSENATAQILSHELTHAIGNTEEYSRLETMILRKMKEDGTYDTVMQRNQNLYADGRIYGRTAEQIRAEVTAEYVSKHLLTDEKSITSLVRESPTIGQRIRAFLDGILAKLGNKAAKERKFITDARNLYAKALGEKQFAYSPEAQYSYSTEEKEYVKVEEAFENLRKGSDDPKDERTLCKAFGLLEEYEAADPEDVQRVVNEAVRRYYGEYDFSFKIDRQKNTSKENGYKSEQRTIDKEKQNVKKEVNEQKEKNQKSREDNQRDNRNVKQESNEQEETNPLDEIEVDENETIIEKREKPKQTKEEKAQIAAEDKGTEISVPKIAEPRKTIKRYKEQREALQREKRAVKREAELEAFAEEYEENAGIPVNTDEIVSGDNENDDVKSNADYESITNELPKNATDTEREMYYNLYKEWGDKRRAFDAIKRAAVNRIRKELGFRTDVTGAVLDEIKQEGGNRTTNPERQKAIDDALSEWENPNLTESETENGIPEPTDEEDKNAYAALLAQGKTPEEANRILQQTYEMRRREALNAKTAMKRMGYRIAGAVADNYFDAKGIIDAEHAANEIQKRISQYIKRFGVSETIVAEAKKIANSAFKLEVSDQKGEDYVNLKQLTKMYRDLNTMQMAGIRGSGTYTMHTINTRLDEIFQDFKWDSVKHKSSKTLELNLTSPENVMTTFFGDTEVANELNDTFIKPVIENSASARRQTNRQMQKIVGHKLTKTESALTQIIAEYMLENGDEKPAITREMLVSLMKGEEKSVERIITAISKTDGGETFNEIQARKSEDEASRIAREIKRMEKSLEAVKKELNQTTKRKFEKARKGRPKIDPDGNSYYDNWRESAKQRKEALEKSIADKKAMQEEYEKEAKDYKRMAESDRLKKAEDTEAFVSLRATLNQISANARFNAENKKGYSIDAVINKAEDAAKDYRSMLNDMYDSINEVSVIHGRGEIKFRKNYMPHRQPDKALNAWEKLMKDAGFDEVTDLPASIAGLTADFRPFRKWLAFAQKRMGTETVYDAVANMERYLYAANEAIYHIDDIMKLRTLEKYIRDKFQKASEDRREEMVDRLQENGEDAYSLYEDDRQMRASSSDYGPLVTWLKNYTDDLAGKQVLSRDQENTIGRTTLRRAGALIRWSTRTMMTFNLASSIRQLSQIPNVIAETGMHAFSAPMLVFNKNNILEDRYRISEKSTFLAEKMKMQRASYQKDIAATKAEKLSNAADTAVNLAEKTWEQTDLFMSKFAVYSFFEKGIENGMNETEALQYADKKARSILASRLRGGTPIIFRSKNVIYQLFTMFQRETLAQWENITKTLPKEWKKIEQTSGKQAASEAIAKYAVSQATAAWIANNIFAALGLGTVAMFDVFGLLFGNFIEGASGVLNGMLVNLIKRFVRDHDKDEENDMTFTEAITAGAKSDGKMLAEFIDDIPFGSAIIAGMQAFGFDFDSRLPLNVPNFSNAKKLWNDIETLDSLGLDAKKETDPAILAQIEQAQKDEWAQFFYHAAELAIDTISVTATGGNQIKKTLNGALSILQAGDYTDGYKQGQLKYTVTGADALRALVFGKSGTLAQQKWVNQNFDTLTKKQTEAYQALTDSGVSPAKAYEIAVGISEVERGENETLANAQAAYIDSLSNLDEEQRASLYYEYLATDKQKSAVDRAVDAGSALADAVDAARAIRDAGRTFEKLDLLLASNLDEDAMRAIYEEMIATKETDESGTVIGYTDDDKINAMTDMGLSFADFLRVKTEYARLNADESITASQKATRFLAALSDMGYDNETIFKIGETFPYVSGFKVEPATYKKLIENGLDANDAVTVTDALSGAKSTADKIAAIWSTDLSGQTLDTAIQTVITEGAYERYRYAIDAGVDVDIYLWVLNNADADGDGYISNEERESAINHLMLGKGQASALWIATGGSQSSNPYEARKRSSKSTFSVPSIGLGSIGLKKIGL